MHRNIRLKNLKVQQKNITKFKIYMIANIIKQQLIGIFNLSIPVIVICALYPQILENNLSIFAISCLVGIYVYYLGNRAAKQQVAVLSFIPSGSYKEELDAMIKKCALDPNTINMRYAFFK